MVDTAAAGAAVGDLGIEDEVVVHAGEFEAVLVAAVADVVDAEAAEDDVAGGVLVVVVAAVVAVEAVAGGASDLKVVEHEVAHAREVEALAAARDDRAGFALYPADPDRGGGGAGEIGEVGAAGVGACVDAHGGAGCGEAGGAGDGAEGCGERSVAGGVVAGGGHVELTGGREIALEGFARGGERDAVTAAGSGDQRQREAVDGEQAVGVGDDGAGLHDGAGGEGGVGPAEGGAGRDHQLLETARGEADGARGGWRGLDDAHGHRPGAWGV